MRLEIESKIVLISGPEKVNDIEAQKLAKRTLGTSKIKEINLRGCYFLVFTLFSCESICLTMLDLPGDNCGSVLELI